jgi:hypothetical protein
LNSVDLIKSVHPSWKNSYQDWEKWRLAYNGGDAFCDEYLAEFSLRETTDEYRRRKELTPWPLFAKSVILEIRNAVYQRMCDITRVGGSQAYREAVCGLRGGVDNRGSSMNMFLGTRVLTDLLVMGRVGVYVDNPVVKGERLSDTLGVKPYLYVYPIENIRSYSCTDPENPSEYESILLQDTVLRYDEGTRLPVEETKRYRHLQLVGGKVQLQYYNDKGEQIDKSGNPAGPSILNLTRIPFVMLDLGASLIQDVCQHQIALLNLGSSDVNQAMFSNFPFYVEQGDKHGVGGHLKSGSTGSAMAGGQSSGDRDIQVGPTHGRMYPKDADRPAYINPSSEPLTASMALQEKLERDIRKLVNLAVMSLATRASAESKSLDNQGLEAGLSFIGLVLEGGERQIAEHWAAYETYKVEDRQLPTIKYPDRYSLKTDADRLEESDKFLDIMKSVPGQTVKREICKCAVQTLLGGRVSVDTIDRINKEIDETPYTSSDPDTVIKAVQSGLCGNETGALALGFNKDEAGKAKVDHIDRIMRIAKAQGVIPGGRGVRDLEADGGKSEKELSRETDTKDSTEERTRGEGK